MTLTYVCSDGTVIDLMGSGIYAQSPETLIGPTWEYSSISGVNDVIRIKRFYKNLEEKKLVLSIMADDAEEFNDLMNKLHVCFETDIKSMTPGRLWWNDAYKDVFIVDSSHQEFDELFESVDKEIKVLSIYPYWTREITCEPESFTPEPGGLDYDYDYDYDYAGESLVDEYDLDGVVVDADFTLTIKSDGGFSSPLVASINGHRYKIGYALKAGEKVVIDSREKTVTLIRADESEENIFGMRDISSDIFKRIESGEAHVLRPYNMRYTLIVHAERGEPEWI